MGEVISRVESAWPSVVSMRSTFWSTESTAGGTPPATGAVTVEEALASGERRLMFRQDGQVTDEQIVVDGRIYMRGALVPAAVAPMVDTETWVEVDPAAANSGSPVAPQISYLLSPVEAPFSGTSGETAGLQVTPGEEIFIAGRACDVLTFGDPLGISYELALDPANLPCRFVQSSGGHSSVTLYEFNPPDLVITAPTVATPIVD